MSASRFRFPRLWAMPALLALAGGLAVTFSLHRIASGALESVLEQRLRGAGESAARLLDGTPPATAHLVALMEANRLEAAYVVDGRMQVLQSATGADEVAALLRVDPDRLARALRGEASVDVSYSLGTLDVAAGYFPLQRDHASGGVLVLEAGEAFNAAAVDLERARWLGVVVSALVAGALGVLGAALSKTEAERRAAAERAARGQVMSRMAAMAAHEIRNPLAVIRGTVDLMRERSGAQLTPRDRQALDDIVGEVSRLGRLTADLLALASDRELKLSRVDLASVIHPAARALESTFPGVTVAEELQEGLWVDADADRLRQVFANLLTNAAQAQGGGELRVRAFARGGEVCAQVTDHGPGVPEALRRQLFDPFVTDKREGTGLGLALSKKLVEGHKGTLRLLDSASGATFEIVLPRATT